jgi:hypothetical protein
MKRLLPVITVLFAVSLYAADFWKTKEPSQWSDDEVAKMLTKSPWSKSVSIQTVTAGSSGRGDTGGGMGGSGGTEGGGGMEAGGGAGGRAGRGGGGGMGDGMPSGPTSPPIIVRWESSAPVQAANARKQFAHSAEITQWSQENYVVSLTGFQTRATRRGAPPGEAGPGAQGAQKQGDRRSGGLPAGTNPNADLPDFRDAAIRHDNKQVFPVDRIMVIRTAQGPSLYLLFSRTNTITAGTKEVTVEFTIDRVATKAKFKVKDMEYRGKREL